MVIHPILDKLSVSNESSLAGWEVDAPHSHLCLVLLDYVRLAYLTSTASIYILEYLHKFPMLDNQKRGWWRKCFCGCSFYIT
jgi:hypothetical protein